MASQPIVIQDPPIARLLFGDTRLAWLWLPLRVWLGWQWLEAGLHKIQDPAWMSTGQALQAFWTRAVAIPDAGKPAVAYDWYRGFLELLLNSGSYTWFAKVVALGEAAIGIGLILGAFTGIAAFFGLFMNWHFVMAGAASTNAMLMVTAMVLVLAWKTAGWIGADRFLLPIVGTPWQPGEYRIGITRKTPPAPRAPQQQPA